MPKAKKSTKKNTKRVSNKSKNTAIPAVKEIPQPVTPAYVTKEVSAPEYSSPEIKAPYITTKTEKTDNMTFFIVGGIVILIMLAMFAL